MLVIEATTQSTSVTDTIGVPLLIAAIGALGAVSAAAVSVILAKLGDAAARRRAGYAEAIAALVAWSEYPYRIRRRTSDDPEVLADLAALGCDLQERLVHAETWVTCEHPATAEVWRQVRGAIGAEVGPACQQAWEEPPVASASGMNLGSWGPTGVAMQIARMEFAARSRFGWRRDRSPRSTT